MKQVTKQRKPSRVRKYNFIVAQEERDKSIDKHVNIIVFPDSVANQNSVAYSGTFPSWTKDVLSSLFSNFGQVMDVEVVSKTSGFIKFKSHLSIKKVVLACKKRERVPLHFPASAQPTSSKGLQSWVTEHQNKTPGNNILLEQVNTWLAHWSQQEAAKKLALEAELDAQGWTAVVHGKASERPKDASGLSVTASTFKRHKKAQNKAVVGTVEPAGVKHFYKQQKKAEQRQQLLDLQTQFKKDKQKIYELKQNRKFKPL